MTEDKTNREITTAFIREFAELNLQLTKECRTISAHNINTELLRELKESAQVLKNLV